jgi:hypothetical protein
MGWLWKDFSFCLGLCMHIENLKADLYSIIFREKNKIQIAK